MIKSTKLQAVCKLFEGWVPCRLEPRLAEKNRLVSRGP